MKRLTGLFKWLIRLRFYRCLKSTTSQKFYRQFSKIKIRLDFRNQGTCYFLFDYAGRERPHSCFLFGLILVSTPNTPYIHTLVLWSWVFGSKAPFYCLVKKKLKPGAKCRENVDYSSVHVALVSNTFAPMVHYTVMITVASQPLLIVVQFFFHFIAKLVQILE